MAIKMIVSDLDGTMLDSDCKIPEENIKAVQAAQAAGIKVTLATGRMHSSALPYAQQLGVETAIITYNGALVKTTEGEVLTTDFVAPATVRAALEYAYAHDHYIQLYDNDQLYFAERVDKTLVYEKAAGLQGTPIGRAAMLEHTENIAKLLVAADNPSVTDALVAELAEALKGKADIVKSNPVYIEILQPGVSKGRAMLALAAKWGIRPEEIMALGDSDNDISMLQAAGLGVAMGQAEQRVKDAADVVTASGDEVGLAQAVRQYALAQ